MHSVCLRARVSQTLTSESKVRFKTFIMTLEKFLSQIGMGTKQLIDRHSEYAGPIQDHHVFYAYEPSSAPSHGHVASSKHNYGGGHKSNASMSALTLLAFLFFLHILQQCIKDHMTEMTAPPVVIMSAGREGEEPNVYKSASQKSDKAGVEIVSKDSDNDLVDSNKRNKWTEPISQDHDILNKNQFTRIDTKSNKDKFTFVHKNYANRSTNFESFVSAMDEE